MKDLDKALEELRQEVRDPYSLFVAEALRSFGVPISDEAPPENLRERVDVAVEAYRAAALQSEPFEDLLGIVYQEECGRRQRNMSGQFFTPWHLCRLIAQMNVVHGWEPGPAPDGGLWSIHEPACGSGGMVLALLAELVSRFGTPGVLLLWDVSMEDVDLACARTSALQIWANLALRGWGIGRLEVHHGNTLSMERFSTVLAAQNTEDPEELPRMWAKLLPIVRMAGLLGQMEDLLGAVSTEAPEPASDEQGQLMMFGAA